MFKTKRINDALIPRLKPWAFSLVVVRIRDSYWEYIENISEKLPFVVRILAKNINLHDAILQQFSYDITKKNVFLSYLGGDLQVGYFILECVYMQVDHCQPDDFFIGKQILSDEIELLEPRSFCQRFLSMTP